MASQAIDVDKPDYTYKSPEALSFQRQGQFQVGEYTGSANISFPLHTIKYKDIELPINLSYNSSGVQVAAEASWVGLNWNLNVGGCINLIPCGGVDALHTRKESNATYKSVLNKRSETDYYLEYNTDPEDKEHILTSNTIYDGLDGLTESDMYLVTTPSGSFHFFINRETGKPEIIGADCKNKVEKYLNLEKTESWKVTDSNGYIYEFECPDRSASQGEESKPYTSAWFLTKITSPQGAVLSLNYTTSQDLTLAPKMSERTNIYMGVTTWNGTSNAVGDSYGYKQNRSFHKNSTVGKKYLKEIIVGNQVISFKLSNRNDLQGGRKLDSFCIIESGQTVKTVCFDYAYFESNTVGSDYLVKYYNQKESTSYSKLRLKLKSFYYKSASQEVSDLHSFEYKEDKGFPNKNSFAVDMWGYYNGRENKIDGDYTFCPEPRYCDVDQDTYDLIRTYKGANRFANPDYVDALSLKKITYPTKGYTEFTFESNTFMKQYQNPFASGRSDIAFTKTYQVQDVNYVNNSRNNYATGPTTKIDFTLDRDTKGTLKVVIDAGTLHLSNLDLVSNSTNVTLMYKAPNQPFIPLQKITISTNSDISKVSTFEKEIDVKLPAGDYMLWADLPSHIKQETGASVKGILVYDVITKSGNKIETMGGGLRVRSIKNYDSDGTLLEETRYEYTNEDGNSSGIHITPNRFYDHKLTFEYHVARNAYNEGCSAALPHVHYLHILDNPIGMTSFVSAINNNSVGYTRVVKRVKNGERVQISNYYNQPLNYTLSKMELYAKDGKTYSYKRNELCSQIQAKNGCLLTQDILDGKGNRVHSVKNNYTYSGTKYKVNFSVENEGASNVNVEPGFLPLLVNCYSFENYWTRLTSTTSTDYTNGIPTLEKTSTYEYDTKNLLVKMTEESTSNPAEKMRTRIDYTTYGLDDSSKKMMNDKNMLNTVVRERKLLWNGVTEVPVSTTRTYYDVINSKYYAPSSVAYSIGNNKLETRTKYSYDSNMNVRSIKIDGVETVYIWSYYGQYPIAKIEGLTYTEVETAIGASTLSSLLNKSKPTDSDLSAMRTAINNKGGYITTYTYKPLVGMLSETKPNGMKITYEYDGFGRLVCAKDHNGKTVATNSYNYK